MAGVAGYADVTTAAQPPLRCWFCMAGGGHTPQQRLLRALHWPCGGNADVAPAGHTLSNAGAAPAARVLLR
jgi:hypothetical protein